MQHRQMAERVAGGATEEGCVGGGGRGEGPGGGAQYAVLVAGEEGRGGEGWM